MKLTKFNISLSVIIFIVILLLFFYQDFFNDKDELHNTILQNRISNILPVEYKVLNVSSNGNVQIEFKLLHRTKYQKLEIEIFHRDNLMLHSPSHWFDSSFTEDNFKTILDVTVPKGENSALDFNIKSINDQIRGGKRIFFDYRSDSLYVYDIDSIPSELK